VREIALKLLAQLRAVVPETKVQFLIETSQFTQPDDPRIADTHRSKAMLVRTQRIGEDKNISAIIFGARWKIAATKAVKPFPVIEKTSNPRSSSTSTTAPCGTSITTTTEPTESRRMAESHRRNSAGPLALCGALRFSTM